MPLIYSYGTETSFSGSSRRWWRSRIRTSWRRRRTHHANVTFSGRPDSRMSGAVFEITDAELAAADQYEQAAAYKRITIKVASGKQVWVYVEARSAPKVS